MKHTCKHCGAEFERRSAVKLYCSPRCRWTHNNTNRTLAPNVRFDCKVCGKYVERYVEPSKLEAGLAKAGYCSRKCAGSNRRGDNHFTAHRNPGIEPGRIVEADGYIMIRAPEHPHANNKGYVFEHRLVMEEHLGRLLDPSEVVHHENDDRGDNRLENLRLFASNGEHLAAHRGITAETVRAIRKLRKDGLAQSAIAARLGVAQATVSRILTGQRWAHIQEEEADGGES